MITTIDIEKSAAIILAAEEIIDTTGQLWVTLGDDEYYMPELIRELKELANYKTTRIRN